MYTFPSNCPTTPKPPKSKFLWDSWEPVNLSGVDSFGVKGK